MIALGQMNGTTRASERISETVAGWSGVTEHYSEFSGREFRFGNRELGHVHGDTVVDLPFQRDLRDDLIRRGDAEPHPDLPDTGWVSYYLRSEKDIPHAIKLFRLSYVTAVQRRKRARLVLA